MRIYYENSLYIKWSSTHSKLVEYNSVSFSTYYNTITLTYL